MAITLGDAFQNWNKDSNLPTAGATVDGGVIDMLEPNLFRDKVMIPGVTYATDVESLMVDNQFAVAFIRKLDKIKVNMCKATKIRQMLIDKTYTTSEYHIFEIEDNGKHREIAELPYYPDRIIQWAIMQVLEEPLMKHFIPTTYAAMSGKKKWNKKFKKRISERGPHAALAKLQEYAEDKDNTRYCLKMDVKKFFPNIDKAILKSLLRRKFKDKDLLWLLDDIVDSYDKGNSKGIPIGSFTSQYFGNFYLSYLDHWAKEQKRVKYYLRYMDDIVILSGDKEYLHRLRDEIAEYLASNLKLTIKENWQVFPSAVRGIDFVGYRYFGEFRIKPRADRDRRRADRHGRRREFRRA